MIKKIIRKGFIVEKVSSPHSGQEETKKEPREYAFPSMPPVTYFL